MPGAGGKGLSHSASPVVSQHGQGSGAYGSRAGPVFYGGVVATDGARETTAGAAIGVRAERSHDGTQIAAVAEVVAAAFGPAEPTIPALVVALRSCGRYPGSPEPLSFVAEVESDVVGHVMLSLCHIDAWEQLVPALVLAPLAVRPDLQGRGVGSALVAFALAAAQRAGAPAVILEGSPAYYGRFGFVAAEPLGFRRPSLRTPRPGFQVRRLAAYQPWMTGTVVYPAPFWELDCVGFRDQALVEQIEAEFG
ncbi:MAG: N-acetyltransferase [Austwickia sp.]|nr:N-acetyltransferase [Austwickia sp.]